MIPLRIELSFQVSETCVITAYTMGPKSSVSLFRFLSSGLLVSRESRSQALELRSYGKDIRRPIQRMSPWLMSGLILVGITAVLSLCFMWIDRDPRPILPSEAIARIRNQSIHSIIDVRDKKDWHSNHYPDALNIPVASIPRALPNKIPDRSISILFYSEGGYKAAAAAKSAQELGYRDVRFLEGPYTNLMAPVTMLTQ